MEIEGVLHQQSWVRLILSPFSAHIFIFIDKKSPNRTRTIALKVIPHKNFCLFYETNLYISKC